VVLASAVLTHSHGADLRSAPEPLVVRVRTALFSVSPSFAPFLRL